MPSPSFLPPAHLSIKIKEIILKGSIFLAAAVIFGLIYTQSPLYSSNQNLYFLYGLAKAGYGNLAADWLANTTDPAPFFSFLVRLIASLPNGECLFYIIYASLQSIYLISLWGILDYLFNLNPSASDIQALYNQSIAANPWRAVRAFLIFTMILFIHSAALRYAFSHWLGDEWVFLLEGGVASQRILGLVLQPSVFAVFLVASIHSGIRRRFNLAILWAAIAATFHPTYLLAASLLIALWNFQQWKEKSTSSLHHSSLPWKPCVKSGLLSVVCLAPIIYLTAIHFLGIPKEEAEAAQKILINFRFPHHADPQVWWNITVAIKLLICASALWIIRRSRLFPVMMLLLLTAASLSLVQLVSHNPTLALLFPWRISILLIPISSTILAVASADFLWQRLKPTSHSMLYLIAFACFAFILLLIGIGILRIQLDFMRKAAADDLPIAHFSRQNLPANSLILIPPKMEDFRLNARMPVYVDFKSHPYRSDEVLEWYRRIKLANRFYQKSNCSVFQQLIGEGITHVILPTSHQVTCAGLGKPLFSDAFYTLYGIDH